MPATKCPRLTAAELDLLLASADADDVVAGGGPCVSRSSSHHPLTNKAKKRKIKRLIDKIRYDAAARMNPQRPVTPPPPVDVTSHIRGKYGDEPEDESIIDTGPYRRKDERRKRAGKARANSDSSIPDSGEYMGRRLSIHSESDADENILEVTLTTPERRVLEQIMAGQSPYLPAGLVNNEEKEEFLKSTMEKFRIAKLEGAYLAIRRATEGLRSAVVVAEASSAGSSRTSQLDH